MPLPRIRTALLSLSLLAQPPTITIPEIQEIGRGGPAVLLIGCMSCRWQTWEPFMARNNSRYRMIAVTLPGFGGTPVPALPTKQPGRIWQDAALEALETVLKERNLRDVVVVGHSFGGFMA